jgi:hypothetical protein
MANYKGQNRTVSVSGVVPQYSGSAKDKVDKGRYLSPSDVNAVVLGSKTANGTFGREVQTGSYITLSNPYTGASQSYVVVGIMQERNGSILAGDPNLKTPIPDSYWNLSGATYAYVFGHLASLGIDVAGESQLVGYPTQFPSVSMVDWNTGAPNARFRVLELLKNNFAPNDKIVKTSSGSPYVYALAMVKPQGARKILLVNKRDRDIQITLPGRASGVQYVDQTTKGNAPGQQALNSDKLTLRGLSVAVVTLGGR